MNNGVVEQVAPQLHLRIEGRSVDIPLNELDVGVLSTDDAIRAAVAENTGIPVAKLRAFAVDRNQQSGDMTMRPEAVFG
jgi:hypothetical protein